MFRIFKMIRKQKEKKSASAFVSDSTMVKDDFVSPEILAIRRSQAVIEFTIDGVIKGANKKFLDLMGYSLEQVVGRHHSIFMPPDEAKSLSYANFWKRLANGEYFVAEFRRVGKNRKEVWIQGSYSPVFDKNGAPIKVIKLATDVTAAKLKSADDRGQITAIGNSQAVITFSLDGCIESANDVFCKTMGYTESEIIGKHHKMFVQRSEQASAGYRKFWHALADGRLQAGEFCRMARNGHTVWLQASYTPILDPAGRPFKIVKYASDITAAKLRSLQFDAKLKVIGASTAVAEWNLKGQCKDINSFLAGRPRMDLLSLLPQVDIERISRGEQIRREIGWPNTKGPSMWLDAMFSQMTDLEGRPEKILMCAVDVTPRRLAIASTSTAMQDMLERMTTIVGTLEQITRTTNMLALNAAVQAGRAGEAGKGFAIVATEVRVLAEQSEKAVAQINALITGGKTQVERLGNIEATETRDFGLNSAA